MHPIMEPITVIAVAVFGRLNYLSFVALMMDFDCKLLILL